MEASDGPAPGLTVAGQRVSSATGPNPTPVRLFTGWGSAGRPACGGDRASDEHEVAGIGGVRGEAEV